MKQLSLRIASDLIRPPASSCSGVSYLPSSVPPTIAALRARLRGSDQGGGACNTAGCNIKIFKQVSPKAWKLVFDETLGSDWFLSTSQEGHFRLMAISVSRKIDSRCPDPSGSTCDFLPYRKNKRWIWQRIK